MSSFLFLKKINFHLLIDCHNNTKLIEADITNHEVILTQKKSNIKREYVCLYQRSSIFLALSSKSKIMDSNSVLRERKLNLLMKSPEKTNNPNSTQKQIAKELGCSDSKTKRYRNDLNVISPNNKKKKWENLNHP